MPSYLARLKRDGDGYVTDDGCFHEDAESVLGDLLGLCGCGRPEEVLRYVLDALRLVAMRGPSEYDGHRAWYDAEYRPRVDDLFGGNTGAEYFMWYMLADKDLTEHGGSVPGWLTALGEEVLADLEAWDAAGAGSPATTGGTTDAE
jgi:hypothetical protein